MMIILKIWLSIIIGNIVFVFGSTLLGTIEKILLGTNIILRGYFEMLIWMYERINRDGYFDDVIDTLKNYHDMV